MDPSRTSRAVREPAPSRRVQHRSAIVTPHSVVRRRNDRRPELLVFTAAVIVFGTLVMAWSALSIPVDPRISLTASGRREGILLGLLFWVVLGLAGGLRIQRLHGHGVLTFHLPFIIAATALGGPTAGAIVAFASTFEARELREAPWYGVLYNHVSLGLSAVAGGLTYLGVEALLTATLPHEARASELASVVAASVVLTALSSIFAATTVMLRDSLTWRETLRLLDMGHRTTAAGEVVVGWLFVVTWSTMGWWGALVSAVLVLVAWAGHDAREAARRDPLTGLLTRPAFDEPLRRAVARRAEGHHAAVLAIDLDGFKAINDRFGHQAGDEVIAAVGERIRRSIRLTDAAVRRGGDEFSVLLADVPDSATALRLAERIHEEIREPIELDERNVSVGASIGLYVLDPLGRIPSLDRIYRTTDRLMYAAKKRGGGIRMTRQPVRTG
jgi:diguanylate cyclase (GGDEF)-like protein